jgi:hypothetical protein
MTPQALMVTEDLIVVSCAGQARGWDVATAYAGISDFMMADPADNFDERTFERNQ